MLSLRSASLHSGICPFFFICLLFKYEPHTTTRLDKGAMPSLKSLWIEGCNSLKVVPKGLMYVTTLQVLEIRYMSEELVERLQVLNGKDGEDFYKVQHVPSILFHNVLGNSSVLFPFSFYTHKHIIKKNWQALYFYTYN